MPSERAAVWNDPSVHDAGAIWQDDRWQPLSLEDWEPDDSEIEDRGGTASDLPGRLLTLEITVDDQVIDADDDGVIDLAIRSRAKVALSFVKSVPRPCPADTNGDGVVTADDLSLFESLVNGQDPSADLNADSSVDSADFAEYLDRFVEGC